MKTNLDSALKKSSLALTVAAILGAGSVTSQAFAQSDDEAMEEVVAVGTRLKGSTAAVLQERQNQAFVADILGAEQISRTGDGDAAAALRRVTGLTLVDGKFIYVRGLGERYSSTQLNGMTVPSPDPTRQVVPLDLFPSGIIESLEVQKSHSPNMPGHFGGGNVNIRTKSIPKEFIFRVNGGLGTNTENFDDGVFYSGGGDDWMGRDDGTRALPDVVANTLATQGSAGINGTSATTLADTQQLLESFNWNIGPTSKSVPANFNLGGTIGNNYELDDDIIFGFLASTAYSNEWQVSVERNGSSLGGACPDGIDFCFTKVAEGDSTEQIVQWSGMLNFGLELFENHKLELTNMILHDMRDRVRDRDYFDGNESIPGRNDLRRIDILYEEREMVTSQLKGTHDFPEYWNTYVDWYVGTSRASRDAPDFIEATFQTETNANGEITYQGLWDFSATNTVRQFQSLNDESDTWGFNAAIPFTGSWYDVEIKVGSDYVEKARDANNVNLFIRNFAIDDDLKQGTSLSDIFSSENIANPDFYFNSTGRGLFQDNTADGDKYSAANKLEAYYFMVDAFLNNTWRISGGIRYERFQQVNIPFEPHSDDFAAEGEELRDFLFNEDDVLPSLALTYIMNDEMQLRLNVSQTIIRPDLRDITSSFYIDPLTEFLVRGSPLLVPTELDNVDLRWEWYMAGGNNVSVALFYKDMVNPIEMVELPGGEGVPQLLTANGQEGELYGLEVEFLHDLMFISDSLDNFFMSGNVTLSDSEVTIGGDDPNSLYSQQLFNALGGQTTTSITNDVRRLVGHSEWVANLQFGYDSPDGNHSASLVYNVFGERIIVPGVNGNEDAQEDPFHSLDFVYSYFPDFNSTIKVRVNNILNDDKLIEQEGLVMLQETRGVGFSVSYQREF